MLPVINLLRAIEMIHIGQSSTVDLAFGWITITAVQAESNGFGLLKVALGWSGVNELLKTVFW